MVLAGFVGGFGWFRVLVTTTWEHTGLLNKKKNCV